MKINKTNLLASALVAAVSAAILHPSTSRADERLFGYSYTADSILPKKGVEFEQWITYRGGREDQVYSRFDFREEIEYGVTDLYTTALYLNFRNTHADFKDPAKADVDKFGFEGISSEHKYQLLNPNTAPVGLLLYGEVTTDGKELELEEKIVLSKNFGESWTVALNGWVEQEWEWKGDETEKATEVGVSAGLSYRLTPHWSLGVEALHEREFEGLAFEHQENQGYWVGPNIHYGSSRFHATLSVLPQIWGRPETKSNLNLEDFERVQVRLIAGFDF